jgi:hypothetical protein
MRYADIEAMLSKALAILAQHDAALPKIRVALALECTKLSLLSLAAHCIVHSLIFWPFLFYHVDLSQR